MKKNLLLVVLITMTGITSYAQKDSTFFLNNNIIKFSPGHLLFKSHMMEYERRFLFDYSSSFVLQGTVNADSKLEYTPTGTASEAQATVNKVGYQMEVQLRKFIIEPTNTTGNFYFNGWYTGMFFNLGTTHITRSGQALVFNTTTQTSVVTNVNDSKYINAVRSGVLTGVHYTMNDKIYIDISAGAGFKNSWTDGKQFNTTFDETDNTRVIGKGSILVGLAF